MRDSFKLFLSSPNSNTINLYFWVFLFVLNDKLLKSKKFSRFCWDILKCELFFIDGQCEHSGYCCQNLKIKYKKIFINTVEKYSSMKATDPVLNRFKPHIKEGSQRITSFSCHSLNDNNYCDDYETRPVFCRNYPYNIFLQYDYIREGCGYKIRLKREYFSQNEHLRKLIKKVYLLNRL